MLEPQALAAREWMEGSAPPQQFFPARRGTGPLQRAFPGAMAGGAGFLALASPNGTAQSAIAMAVGGQEAGRGQERGMDGKRHG